MPSLAKNIFVLGLQLALSLAFPLETSAEKVASVLLAVITKLSEIVAPVPALFTVIVISEF